MTKAIVIIDVQNIFINNKTKDIPKKIADHLENNKYDYIIFTRFVNDKNSQIYKKLKWNKCFESPDIDIYLSLKSYANRNNTFDKNGYSIFKQKELLKLFKENNINNIYLCGLSSDACVLASAFEGFDLGFNIIILKELTATFHGSDNHHKHVIEIMETCFIPPPQ